MLTQMINEQWEVALAAFDAAQSSQGRKPSPPRRVAA